MVLETVDLGLQAAGIVVGLVWVWALRRDGRWRDPLAGSALPTQALPLPAVLLLLLVFLFLPGSVLQVVGQGVPSTEWQHPESPAQALSSMIDGVTKLVLIGLFLAVRWANRQRPAPASWANMPEEIPGPTPLRRRPVARWIGQGVLAVLVLLPVTTGLVELGNAVWRSLTHILPPTHPVLEQVRALHDTPEGLMPLVVGAVIIAPLAEELLFRGLLLPSFVVALRSGWGAIVATGLLFGWIHANQVPAILPLATMGVVLGYLRLRTGSLWPCLVVHCLFNTRSIVWTILAPEMLRA